MTGEKFDDGKPRAGLVIADFACALQKVIDVGTFGANKYSERGWRTVPEAYERYYDALWRHLLADITIEVDDESGLDHLAHAAWNILALLDLRHRK